MVFELADELQYLKRVEAEISHQFMSGCGFEGPPTQSLHNGNRVVLEPIGEWNRRICTRRSSAALRFVSRFQAFECSTEEESGIGWHRHVRIKMTQ